MLKFVSRTFAALVVCSTVAVFAEDAAAVQKQIAEKMGTIKSLRAKMVSKMDNSGPQFKMMQQSEGTYEYVKKGEKSMLYRMETKSTTTMEMAGEKQPEQKSDSLSICDGQFMYSVSEMAGQKSATKMKMQEGDPTDVTTATKDYDLKVLPEEKVDGQDCWVLEMTPKAGSPQAAQGGKMVSYYRKDCGWNVKMVMLSAEGKPTMTTEYKDVEVNPTIEPSRFVFTPPAGVSVQDLSNG